MQVDFIGLFEKYREELYELSVALRDKCEEMRKRNMWVAFSDMDGEMLYMLIREGRPETVFEVSPNAGWSTNYLLAALTKNGKGMLHSFDIIEKMNGKPFEQVIRENQCALCDQKRLTVYIGDAREEVKKVQGDIDFMLIDSCHEAWFAEWYVAHLFPRVNGQVFVQDIANVDRLESSSEASYMWKWLHDERVDFSMIGRGELAVRANGVRDILADRRAIRSNSVLFAYPLVRTETPPLLDDGPDFVLKQAKAALDAGDRVTADRCLNRIVNMLMRNYTQVNRHRPFMNVAQCYRRMGKHMEAKRCCQQAFGIIVQGDSNQRKKGLSELPILFLRQHQWRLLISSLFLILSEPRIWSRFLHQCIIFAGQVVRR